MSIESIVNNEEDEKTFFSHLGLKSRIPDNRRYFDLGPSRDSYKTYKRVSKRYGQYRKGCKDVGGMCFYMDWQGGTDCYITYNTGNQIWMKLIAIHEETHALQFLRPDHLERLFYDKYNLKVDVLDDNKFWTNVKVREHNLHLFEKKLYTANEFHKEIIARLMSIAYATKHKYDYDGYGALDMEAMRLYHKLKM